jgi:thymidine phosphorylase
MKNDKNTLHLRRLGIDAYMEAVVYTRKDCPVCTLEGFETPARVCVTLGDNSLIATLNTISSDLIDPGKASLSEYAWKSLGAKEGDAITITHPKFFESLSFVRSKIYGNKFSKNEINSIIEDIAEERYSDTQISAFLTACASHGLDNEEIINLTEAMVNVGDCINWHKDLVVDKHCVGGLPGNRITPIIVPIVTAFGLIMPKTSSRAITSPSGTADTMEVLAPVELDIATMKKLVNQEGGFLAWGGSVSLSPADDILIRIERSLDLDSEDQLIASVLSKKKAAGSTHIVIEIPIGPTAKVRSIETANRLKSSFELVAWHLGLQICVLFTDGSQPVGFGIGPALEARDILNVLQCKSEAPQDLRTRALTIAGLILEFSPNVLPDQGFSIAEKILDSGQAWQKFQSICHAQGGMRQIPTAPFTHPFPSPKQGHVTAIDNRRIALVAKLAGAPNDKVAGIDLHTRINSIVEKGTPLFTVHAQSKGELHYALSYLADHPNIIQIQN